MKKGNIIIVFGAVLLVTVCITSPLFVVKIQNQKLVGNVHLVKNVEKYMRESESLTMLEKIDLLVQKGATTGEQTVEQKDYVLRGEGEREYEEDILHEMVLKTIIAELDKLSDAGVILRLFDTTEKNFPGSVQIMDIVTDTYMDEQFNSVTVRNVGLSLFLEEDEILVRVLMEEESGKVIAFNLESRRGILSTDVNLSEMAHGWEKYLGEGVMCTVSPLSEGKGTFGLKDKDIILYYKVELNKYYANLMPF